MTTTTMQRAITKRRGHAAVLWAVWRSVGDVLGWPARVFRARQLLAQLGGMDDHALRDIGLMRQDLRDATALNRGADPSAMLANRAAQRRRGR